MFYFFYVFIWCLTLLPLSVLYIFSDLFYLIVYYLVGYRKKVIRKNLLNSFPEKSEKELRKIERQFYRYFCDLIIEMGKQLHMSVEEMQKRMVFKNIDLMLNEAQKGKSIMLMSSHYCNWEWTSIIPYSLSDNLTAYPVYKKLSNKNFDKFMFELRCRFGAVNVEMHDLMRFIVKLKRDNKQGMYGMISDQSPGPNSKMDTYWMTFLNQNTPVITGTEQIARRFGYPVFYADIIRIKRGYYKCDIIPVSLDPTNSEPNEITEKFMRVLENRIKQEPQYWLWSHNRWKRANKINQNEA